MVALNAPSDGSASAIGVPITVSATATDIDDRVAGVEFFENGVKIGATITSAPYSVSWTPVTEGTRTLTARATDNFDLATTSAAVTVNVRALLRIVAPARFASGLTGVLTVTADAADNAGLTMIEIQVDGQPVGGIGSDTSHSVDVDTNAYASGQHILRARASDAAGNPSAWVTATVSFGGNRTQPAGFTLDETWITGLPSGTAFAQTPDGRLLVALKGGAVRVVKNGVLLPDPMLSVTAVDESGERGLIGVAVHPDFANNGWVYVHHTTTENGAHNRITRFTASGDVADNPTVLVDLPALSVATVHNGGGIQFGSDGKLYVAVGDSATAPRRRTSRWCSARCCASTTMARSRTTTRTSPRRPAWLAPSGRAACGTRSLSPSNPAPAVSTSTMSAKAPGRRSISARRRLTTAGRAPKARPARPGSQRHSSPTCTATGFLPDQALGQLPGGLPRQLLLHRSLLHLRRTHRPSQRQRRLCLRPDDEGAGPTGGHAGRPGRRAVRADAWEHRAF